MNTNKDKYRAFCETRDDIPIFSEPWWLDAVCVNGDWDVCLVIKDENIEAALPYYLTKQNGLQVIRTPKLTPYLGVLFFHSQNIQNKNKFIFEQNITTNLIQQLPKVTYTQLIHHPKFTNWLPFFWAGYKQTTMYSFNLNIQDTKAVYNTFRKNLKRDLKKAASKLICKEKDDFDLFFTLHKSMYQKQQMQPPYSYDFFKKLDTILKKKNKRKILFTFDNNGNILSTGYFVWDKNTAYFLASGRQGTNRLAMTWTTWQAIQIFSKKVQTFDFAGSIIKNIVTFNSKFTTTPAPYHHTFKGKNKLIDILKILKS